MNKLQALIKCRNLWSYMAITGSDLKSDYKPARRWAFHCLCCVKAGATRIAGFIPRDCRKCILNGYAWKSTNRKCGLPCEYDPNSYFDLWDKCTDPTKRKYYALRMVYACNQAIEDLLIHGKLR